MTSPTIICPKCKSEIPVEEALGHSIQEKLEKEFEKKLKDKEGELMEKLEKEGGKEIKLLKEELQSKSKKLVESQELELELRKQKLALEEKEREFELTKQRQIDAEREKIRLKVETEMLDSQRLHDREKDKVIDDLKKALDDAQRKANQGSQQTQGEVAELDLEETLKIRFLYDAIEPVGKGVRGADIRQVVKTSLGNVCGTILWESKRTKAWSAEWVTKLKDDLRSEKANVAVIVSTVLPEEAATGIGLVDGVWVVSYALYLVLAELLRQKLIDVAREKYVSQNKSSKAEVLYNYIVSHEFGQQVEAIVEVYQDMQSQIARERAAFEKLWKTREAQVNRLVGSTANIIGSLRGSVGSTLPSIKGLDLPGLEEGGL
ncbi:hypothetical protein A3A84_03495 [Candidatus Collierbacteria bacterium RIFCSPLOWO2_01_FULL_50_23]|uniref:DUF2130 domain-containing protein n=2 Tax=Candidatus Collieribacteriota TaxID=1752725 RepID=A0A1F5EXF6_9BACT|nr:MAG: hypothetical protein A2703_03805 [Candidatus Collierbacteria bacterium RIFCSPHIGHO2_01_FULL_50_25]OGD75219.1 MAG: hypothetical protein A3A84_03495 [Candidatus Collierbacteria bacterium RIFCSPLOWO2_01_FULL_50_23]